MREDDALEGNGADVLGTYVVAFLRRREQRVQHLDRRLEHLDELEDALGRAVEAAGIGIRVGIGLAEEFELADVNLADKRGNVLRVLVAGLGLGDADLADARGMEAYHREFRNVAPEFIEPLHRPGRGKTGEAALRDAVLALDLIGHAQRVEHAERALEDRADLFAGLQRVNRQTLHQELQPFGQGRLAAADGTQQVEHLLPLFEALRSMAEVADDPLDRLLHAVEIGEVWIDPDGPVHEDAAKTRIVARIDDFGLADRGQHPFGRARIGHRLARAAFEIVLDGHLRLFLAVVQLRKETEYAVL